MKKYSIIISKLFSFNRKNSIFIILSLVLMNISEIFLIGLISPVYDLLTNSPPSPITKYISGFLIQYEISLDIILACSLLALSGLAISLFRTYSSWLLYSFKENFMKNFTSKIIRSTLEADYLYILKQNSGNLINSLTFEMERAGGSFVILFNFLRDTILVISLFVFLLATSWKLLFIFILLFIPLSLIIKVIHTSLENNSHEITHYNSSFVKRIKEIFDNVKDIKAMNVVEDIFNWSNGDSLQRLKKIKKSSILAVFSENIQHFIMILGLAVTVVISKEVLNVDSSSIVLLIGGLVRISPKISSAQRSIAEFITLYPGYEIINSLIDDLSNTNLKKDDQTPLKVDKNIDYIKIDNISFSYNKNTIINDFSAQINRGEITVISGQSGSGKSTLLNILLGLTKPTKGKVVLMPERDISYRNYVRGKIGYLGQESGLFDSSIKKNIKFFNQIKDEGKIKNLLSEFKLTNKELLIDSNVGDKGLRISAGQRQRVLLIRALIRSPQMLFLDEATNNLDKDTEKIIYEKLNDIKNDMFIILISHNPSVEEIADQIIRI